MASYEALVKEYRKLAKRADQRLVRLEALAWERGFEHVKEWAYKNAMRDIQVYSGEGAKRFNTKPPGTKSALQRKINDIKNFLGSKTSTKKDIKDTYKKRVDSINDRFNTSFSVDDFQRAIESGAYERLKSDYGYNTAIEVIDKIERDKDTLVQIIIDAKNRDIQISDNDKWSSLGYDMIMQQTIEKELEKDGISLLDLK